jgi:single-stranded DNA-binding protein
MSSDPCINLVVLQGTVAGRIEFSETGNGSAVCTFEMVVKRPAKDTVVSAKPKINVYGDGLVETCRRELSKGRLVTVQGELMTREGRIGDLTEVRARTITFH